MKNRKKKMTIKINQRNEMLALVASGLAGPRELSFTVPAEKGAAI